MSTSSLIDPLSEATALTAFATRERAECFEAIVREFAPVGFIETLLARDAARQAARMLRDEQLLDEAGLQATLVVTSVIGSPPHSAVAHPGNSAQLFFPDRFESLARTAERNSQGLYSALRRLRQVQQERAGRAPSFCQLDPRFSTEPACVAHLARRFQVGSQQCRGCGATQGGSWIAARKAWECKVCHRQTCVRFGTVMANSRLRLVTWFHAIRVVLFCTPIAAADFAAAISLSRVRTARLLLKKIETATLANDSSQRLAGLDHVYLPGPELCAL